MPTKKPTKVTKKVLGAVLDAARLGKIADAMPALEQAATEASAAAAYALAEIHALRGEWDLVLDRLALFMPHEDQIYAGNVKRDVAGLLWRAAEETKRWKEGAALLAKLDANAVGAIFHRSLLALMKAGGKGKPPTLTHAIDTPKKRAAAVAKAKAEKDAFSIVMAAKEDAAFDADVVKSFAAAARELDQFDYVLDCLPAFVRKKKLADGWKAFVQKLPDWMNVEDCQIAPIVVVWDPTIRSMMTPERSRALLARDF